VPAKSVKEPGLDFFGLARPSRKVDCGLYPTDFSPTLGGRVVICVGTPSEADGSLMLNHVRKSLLKSAAVYVMPPSTM